MSKSNEGVVNLSYPCLQNVNSCLLILCSNTLQDKNSDIKTDRLLVNIFNVESALKKIQVFDFSLSG